MKFEHAATIAAPKDKVWAFLMDVPRVGQCVPGVEAIESLGGDHYRGSMRISVGPIRLTFTGDAEVVTKDEAAGKAEMQAHGVDQRQGGAVRAAMTMTLAEQPGSGPATELRVVTDAQIMGKLGEFGQPIIRKKADQMMKQFVENVSRELSQG